MDVRGPGKGVLGKGPTEHVLCAQVSALVGMSRKKPVGKWIRGMGSQPQPRGGPLIFRGRGRTETF